MKNNASCKLSNQWLGKLELIFSVKEGRSILIKNSHYGPFFIQKCFYPETDKITPHVYLLHPPGGLVGGDQLTLVVKLKPKSHALLTTPGSDKFYRTNGMYASKEYTFKLENGAILEWVPQSSIFFPKTKAQINTIFELASGARMISFEMLCFRNLILNDAYANPEEIDIFLNIQLPCSVGLRDRLKINTSDCISKLSGFQISASLFAVPSDETILKQVRKLIKPIQNVQIGGVTLLDELLVVRLLSNDNQKLKELLHHIWYTIRPAVVGKKAFTPRVWLT